MKGHRLDMTNSRGKEKSSIRDQSELTQRIITGSAGAVVIIGSLSYSEWGFLFVYFTLAVLLLQEFYRLWEQHGIRPMRSYGLVSGMLVVMMGFLVARGTLSPNFYFLLFPHFSIAFLIKLYDRRSSRSFEDLAVYFLGQVYIAVPLSLLAFAVFDGGGYRSGMSVAILLFLWANESGAYFVGKAFGKHKLFERISPKKSWEGSIGGALLSLYICVLFIFSYHGMGYHPAQWILVSVVMILASNFGDLVESMFKRGFELKDSGQAIPGHGGFLDRFDGLIYSGPFVAAILEVF